MNYRRTLAPYPPVQPEVGWPGRLAPPDPAQILQALRRGDWDTAVRQAMNAGITDVNQLTDTLFYILHPEMRGRRIASSQRNLAREWIAIRDRRVRPVLESRGRSPAGASAPPAPAPPVAAPNVVWPREPLPPADKARFQVALDSLWKMVASSNDPRSWRYNCWLSKLAAGADDRVIEWHRVCPTTSGAIGAAYVVGPCDITAGSSVDQAALQDAIKSISDIEPANQRLEFITYMRSDILFAYEMTSPSVHLENFRLLHDEVNAAIVKLDQWANSPMGGSSAMPAAYVSIKDWIGVLQRDPNSVYSCL